MFTGFPKLSKQLLNTLCAQHFRFYTVQDYPVSNSGSFLYSPFREKHKAVHYHERLHCSLSPALFNLDLVEDLESIYAIALSPTASNGYVKIIEHNFKLGNYTRKKIATFVERNFPMHYKAMIKNNFRIVIGDNFGDIFYNIRIGQDILLPVLETDLEKLSEYVPGPQQVL